MWEDGPAAGDDPAAGTFNGLLHTCFLLLICQQDRMRDKKSGRGEHPCSYHFFPADTFEIDVAVVGVGF